MRSSINFLALALAGLASFQQAHALPTPESIESVEPRQSAACSSYTIINTRGTGEIQGPSSGFRSMNSQLQSKFPGGEQYNTVYPADISQVSTAGTQDIIRKVNSIVSSQPNRCIILQGYSQGAAATTNALRSLTGNAFNAVKAVVMIGNPLHKAGLACNVDNKGGTTTKNVNGIQLLVGQPVPDNWISKTIDICIFGDGVCDTAHGFGITPQHLAYPLDSSTQTLGFNYMSKALQG